MKVIFFPNGNTAVLKDDKQVAELQKSWLILFVEFLTHKGIDPTKVIFTAPDGNKIEVFETAYGDYSWRII